MQTDSREIWDQRLREMKSEFQPKILYIIITAEGRERQNGKCCFFGGIYSCHSLVFSLSVFLSLNRFFFRFSRSIAICYLPQGHINNTRPANCYSFLINSVALILLARFGFFFFLPGSFACSDWSGLIRREPIWSFAQLWLQFVLE